MKSNHAKRLWKGFWQLADPKIWIASTVPMIIGAVLAFTAENAFSALWFIVSLAALYLIEIGKNAVNEVVDYQSGVDRDIPEDKRTPFSGGKKSIAEGKLTTGEATVISILTLSAACILGMVIVFFRELHVMWFGLAGVALSVLYSVPPFKLAYRGLGEITVGLTFGPLVMSGIYLVMANRLDWRVPVMSLPVAFLIANVLWINQYPDCETDLKGGKRNWVVRLGRKKALKGYAVLFIAAFVSIAAAGAVYLNPFLLIGLIGILPAWKAVKIARIHFDDIQTLMAANALTVRAYQWTGLGLILGILLWGYVPW